MKNTDILILLCLMIGGCANAQSFEVSYGPDLIKEDFSGNILLYLSKEKKSPKNIFVGLELTPVYRIVVDKLGAQEVTLFDDHAISYPVELSNIERGAYYVQVVFDLNIGEASIGSSTGNLYSMPIQVELNKNFDTIFTIEATEVVAPMDFVETNGTKELSVKSALLSNFHMKDVFIHAAVTLPENYSENPKDKYPVIFSTSGFGGNYKRHSGKDVHKSKYFSDQEVIVVHLDGQCPEGHSTYANSDVNGPWGDALVNEFIPTLNEKFRTNGANLLYGHSSGGWTTLWLQINYPKTFVGAWASSPDQVDFRNYQNKNIYEADNMFYDNKGHLLADVTIAGRFPVVSSKDFYRTEHVIYRGSQLHSFDAVFGGYDEDNNRIRLVNLPSGEVNKKALPLWRRYDLSILLRENWHNLKADLDNRIRISIGESDNFHLHHAVKLLDDEMQKLDANIKFEYYPGDHFTILTPEYRKDGLMFLEQCYNNWLKK